MKYLFLLMAHSLLFISCSKVDKMQSTTEDMKRTTETMSVNTESMSKTTEAMSATTSKMADTTDKMGQTTSHMDQITSTMYHQVRTKESEDTRAKKIANILDRKSGMGEKLAGSSVYFQAFEFQFWTNDGSYDTQHVREMLFLDATNEFYRRLADIYKQSNLKDMSPLNDDTAHHNDEMAMYALATAMHFNNHHQELLFEQQKGAFEMTSLYDIVKSAMRKEAANQPLTDYEAVVVTGQNKEITIALLNARFNMLLALAVKNMSSKENMDLGQMIDAGFFQIFGGGLGKLRLKNVFDTANDATKDDVIAKLDGALKVKALMKEIHQNLVLDKSLKSIINNLQLIDLSAKNEISQKAKDYNKEFNDKLGQLKN